MTKVLSEQEKRSIIRINRYLLSAADENDLEKVKELLVNGANVNAKDQDGTTCLHYAVLHKNKDIIYLLLEFGVDTSLKNDQAETALELGYRLNKQDEFGSYSEVIEALVPTQEHSTTMNQISDSICNPTIAQASKFVDFQNDVISPYNTSLKNIEYIFDKFIDFIGAIKNRKGAKSIEINSQKCDPDFLEQDKFYETLESLESVWFIELIIRNSISTWNDTILHKLKKFGSALIIRCKSQSFTSVYVKQVKKDPIVLNLQGLDSELVTAIKEKKYDTFAYLKSKGFELKDEKEKRFLRNLKEKPEAIKIKEALIPYFVQAEKAHIWYLMSKSRSSIHTPNFREKIDELYRNLDMIPEVSIILKVIQYSDSLDIIFDYSKNSIVDIDPTEDESTQGKCLYENGRIYVGANDETKLKGTLAHELTHWAMQLIFNNHCKPYRESDDENKKNFNKIIKNYFKIMEINETSNKKEIKEKLNGLNDIDEIIKNVFLLYYPENYVSELIVRVPHMLAAHGQDGQIELLKVHAPLFKFYNDIVMVKCQEFLDHNFLIRPWNFIKLVNQYSSLIECILESNIEINQTFNLMEQLKNYNIIVMKTSSTFLGSIYVYQSLQQMSPNSYIFLSIDKYKKQNSTINKLFFLGPCNLLVLECNAKLNDEYKTLENLFYLIKKESQKKIFLITQVTPDNQDNLGDNIKKKLGDQAELLPEIKFTLNDLTNDSQIIILSKKVLFQGFDICLSELIDNDIKELIDSETLVSLIQNCKVAIGNHCFNNPDIIKDCLKSYYKDREFTNNIIKNEILSNPEIRSLFAISGNEKEIEKIRYASNVRFRPLSIDQYNAMREFQQLCNDPQFKNVHWLKIESGKLIWQQSKGSVCELDLYKEKQSEFDLLHRDDKVIIISDTAGMGKSTFLSHLFHTIKQKQSSLWVVLLNFNDCTKQLDKLNIDWKKLKKSSFDDVDEAIGFLSSLLKLSKPLEQKLFKHKLSRSSMILLFDGFDEVCPTYEDIVVSLIEELTNKTNVRKLVITTRPYTSKPLEDRLNVLLSSLCPFSRDDQIRFLINFWEKRENLGNLGNKKLMDYATLLIDQMVDSINDREEKFTSVPLQMRMLAEVFDDQFEISELKLKTLRKLDIMALYQLFIEKKYRIYSRDVKKEDITNVAVQTDNEDLFKIFVRNHQLLALNLLLKEEEQDKLLTIDEKKQINELIFKIKVAKEKTGLIDRIVDDKPLFVHPTFGEYFFAEYFFANQSDNNERRREFLLTNVLLKSAFKGVRKFLDDQLAMNRHRISFFDQMKMLWERKERPLCNEENESILIIAAKEKNENICNFILSEISKDHLIRRSLVNAKTSKLNTALQISARNDNWELVKLLVENGANDDGERTVLQMVTFQYNWDMVEWLLKNGNADVNKRNRMGMTLWNLPGRREKEVDNIEEYLKDPLVQRGLPASADISDKSAGWTTLHMAARVGQLNVIRELLKKNANINQKADDGKSVLHLAVRGGNKEIVELLVKNGADIDAIDLSGVSVLQEAEKNCENKEIVKYLQNLASISLPQKANAIIKPSDA